MVFELRGQDLNLRPRGYEPRELPGCSTPRLVNEIIEGRSPEVEGAFGENTLVNGYAIPWIGSTPE